MSKKNLYRGDLPSHLLPTYDLAFRLLGQGRSVMLVGSPGVGKTMIARRLVPAMADLWKECWKANDAIRRMANLSEPAYGLTTPPLPVPFRAPHHTVSVLGMSGRPPATPGEVNLAHGGILFLDEFPEFRRAVIDVVILARRDRFTEFYSPQGHAAWRIPSLFGLVAASNPCPCGYLGHSTRACVCTAKSIERYQAVPDRLFDAIIDVPEK